MKPPEGMNTSRIRNKRPKTRKTDGQNTMLIRPSFPVAERSIARGSTPCAANRPLSFAPHIPSVIDPACQPPIRFVSKLEIVRKIRNDSPRG